MTKGFHAILKEEVKRHIEEVSRQDSILLARPVASTTPSETLLEMAERRKDQRKRLTD
jgi:hypothetical protein